MALPQTQLELLLVTRAATRGATCRFDTELIFFDRGLEGYLSCSVLDQQAPRIPVRCKYLVSADGGRSRIVDQLKMPLITEPQGGICVNVYLHCDRTSHGISHCESDTHHDIGMPGCELGQIR